MTDDRIQLSIERFAPGAKLRQVEALEGGISATMKVFEIERPDGLRQKLIARRPSPWKFKANPDVAAEEYRVLQVLHSAGLASPPPMYLENRTAEVPDPFFVVEFIEGRPQLNPSDVSGYLDKLASQLAQIHQVDLTGWDLTFLPTQDRGYSELNRPLNEEMREAEIRRMLEPWSIFTSRNPMVLRHGDFWPGNVLWIDGEISGVIDWEETMIGEPLADLAISRLDVWWILGSEASDEFTRRYQLRMNLDLTSLPYWDLCASLRPMKGLEYWASSYPKLGRPDVTVDTMRRDHRGFVIRAIANLYG
ncbi:MAG: phosphotransferase [Fimbriimonadaceae bacterium]|nr:phosphotransferase [Fimbriimonadaceae bacterium]